MCNSQVFDALASLGKMINARVLHWSSSMKDSLETGDLPFLMFDSPLSICLVFHPIGIIHLCESKFCKGNIVYRIMQSAKLFKLLHHAEQKYYMIVHFANCHTLHSFALCIVFCRILHFALFFYWSSASMDGFSVLLKLHKYDLTKQIGMSNLSCQFLKRLVGFF